MPDNDDDLHWWDQYKEARYGRVRLDHGHVVVERTDVEENPVTGRLEDVTEWIPFHWVMRFAPSDQEEAYRALVAGFETTIRCGHSGDDDPCEPCKAAIVKEFRAFYREAVPWADQTDRGAGERLAKEDSEEHAQAGSGGQGDSRRPRPGSEARQGRSRR
jgi:hypothetical protein